MMKSFFKKLAFVMALAMVVSAMAPAATAKAAEVGNILRQEATSWEDIKTTDVLTEGDTQDYKFGGAPSDWRTRGLKWESSKPEFATVDQTGLVKAVAAGETVISVKGEGFEAAMTLTVKAKEVAKTFTVTQKTANTVELKFDDATAATKDVQVIKVGKTTTGVETTMVWPVNKVEVKNGVATVTAWANFGTGDYRFVANGTSVDKSLKIGNPDFAVITYSNTYEYSATEKGYIVPQITVFDENGVALTGYNNWYFELQNTGANAYIENGNGNLYLWAVGAKAQVKGTLTYVVGNETKTIEAYTEVDCVPVPDYTVNASIEKYALVKTGTAADKIAWGKTEVIIGPDTYVVAGIVKDSDNKTKSLTSVSVDSNNGLLDAAKYYAKYESSDKSVVLVDDTYGTAVGVNVGSAYILVSLYKADANGDSTKDVNLGVIAAIPVGVGAARKATGISLDKPVATLLTSGDFTTVTVKPSVVDQYTEAYADKIDTVFAKVNDTTYSDENGYVTLKDADGNVVADNGVTFTIDAADFHTKEVNSLNFTVKMKSGLTTNFVLTVKKLPGYVNEEFALKVNGAELLDATKRTAKVEVVSSWAGSNYKETPFFWGKPENAKQNDLYVTVTAPDGKDITSTVAGTTTALTFDAITGTDENGKLTTMAKGQYIVKLNKVTQIAKDSKGNDIVNTTVCDVKYFDINHNLKGITDFNVKSDIYASSADPITKDNVEFKFDGKAWTDAANAGIVVLSVDKKELDGNLYVYSFTLKIPFGDGYYTVTQTVGKLFKAN